MRRLQIILSLLLCTILVAAAPSLAQGTDGELIDVKANLVYPHKVNDTLSVLCLVGEFAAQHNGALITADSAVRFENERLECFGNVLINKNTTYAYADEAVYSGKTNIATLKSPLVKVVDEDITLYTFNFSFNTMSNVGQYWGNGVTVKTEVDEQGEESESVMESDRGYYYANDKVVVGVENVQFSNTTYLMSGDSVSYDMLNERAYFFEETNIWNEDDYLYGDLGLYDKLKERCYVNLNGYMLTKDQEVWSDSMEYYIAGNEAILRNNIQMDDVANMSLMFGGYAHYWGEGENVLLSQDPAVVNYNTADGADTLFLRGDTIRMYSEFIAKPIPIVEEEVVDSLAMGVDSLDVSMVMDSLTMLGMTDSLLMDSLLMDSLLMDSMLMDSLLMDSLLASGLHIERSKSEIKKEERAARMEIKRRETQLKAHNRLIDREVKLLERIDKRTLQEKSIYSDSMVLLRVRSMLHQDSLEWGFTAPIDTLSLDSLLLDSLLIDSLFIVDADSLQLVEATDSVYRTIIAYGDVRAYRSDLQMICDSMVVLSADSTMQLHLRPVLWSGANQVSSTQMNFYTKGGNLDYADMLGNPIMSSEVVPGDTTYYNQVSGKTMKAIFENNEIVQNDVDGNVQTIYFMQDETTQEPTTIAKVESGNASFYIENQYLSGVTYRTNPEYVIAPLDKVPVDVKYFLDNFVWYEDLHPTRETIFNKRIRPSIREEKSALTRPLFPIRLRITQARMRLVSGGEWLDRTDGVSDAATEWMKSLGFTPGEPRPADMQF